MAVVGQVVATKDGRTGLVVDRGHGFYTVQIDDEHGGGQVKLRGNQLQIDGAFAGSPPQAGAPGQPAAPGASAAGLVLPDGSVPEGKVEYDEHLGKHASTNFLRPSFPPHAREICARRDGFGGAGGWRRCTTAGRARRWASSATRPRVRTRWTVPSAGSAARSRLERGRGRRPAACAAGCSCTTRSSRVRATACPRHTHSAWDNKQALRPRAWLIVVLVRVGAGEGRLLAGCGCRLSFIHLHCLLAQAEAEPQHSGKCPRCKQHWRGVRPPAPPARHLSPLLSPDEPI